MTMSLIPFNLSEAKDTGFFACGTSQSGKTTLCKHLVKTIVDNGINVYVIDISKAWTVDTPIDNIIEVPSNASNVEVPVNLSTVIDLSQLGYEQRKKYVIAFSQAIYNYHQKFGFKKAPFEFVLYEEAHTYLPNGCFARSGGKYAPMIDLVTVGANFNLRFGAITQFPALIDKNVIKICQQRYFGWTTEKNDLAYIEKFIGKEHTDPKQCDTVFNLNKGQFLYQLRNRIEKIQSAPYEVFRPKFSLNGQSVEFKFNL